jgi:hypothetical protein
MRRSFKLATVFTGAAALAGGYGPTAFAATTQATALGLGQWQLCGNNNNNVSHYLHIYYSTGHPPECIGGIVKHLPTNATVNAFCPGNNSGSLFGSGLVGQEPGPPISFYDGEGMQRIGKTHISAVSIWHWTGTDKC